MALVRVGQTVRIPLWIVVASCAHPIHRAAIPVLMDVDGVLLPRIQTLDVRDDFYLVSILGKFHLAMTFVP